MCKSLFKRAAWYASPLSFLQVTRYAGRDGNPSERFRTSRNDSITTKQGRACFHLLMLLAVVVVFSGCMIGPDYQRPTVDTPQTWRFEEKEAKNTANTAWWEQFNDPVLNELIQTALRENKDVKIAAARVEQFIGQYRTTRAALFPQVGAGANYGRQRTSELTGPSPLDGTGIDPHFNSSELFLNAAWEIDIWGKLRRSSEAARAELLSTEEARRAVILTLVTSVASAYVNLRDLDKQLEVTRQAAKNYKDSYDLFSLRFQYGIVSQIEVSQAKSQYEQALANIPLFEKNIAQQENNLSTLLGRNPGPVPRGKTIDQLALPNVPAGLPSELLENRPDIRQAEQNLIAANANIGVAKAQYFPSISLTGMLGLASNDLSDLFKGPAKTWSWAAPATMPIFTAGAIAGQVKAAEAMQQQALFNYEKSIQNAFREVEDALVDQKRTREQLQAQKKELEALRDYVRLARLRYDNGYTSYLEVLYAENRLYGAELSHTQTQGNFFNAFVSLYKAMGGGWVVTAEGLAVSAESAQASAEKK